MIATFVMIAPPIAAAAISAWLTQLLIRRRIPGLAILDHPNERSLHRTPVPRSGGVAVLAGVAAGLLPLLFGLGVFAVLAPAGDTALPIPSPLIWIGVALALVAGVSLADDRRGVSRRLRLMTHGIAAGLLVIGGLEWSGLQLPGMQIAFPAPLAVLLSVLHTVWMINLYNFMDGMDGLAGSMAVLGFGTLGLLGLVGAEPLFAGLCLTIAAAAAGFLSGNLPPARIFLGDVGSSSLGLLGAACILWGADLGLFPLWVGWLAFSPFIVDATWTLIARALRKEPLWNAHRSHHYQRLVLAGWGHRRTLLWAIVLMTAAAAAALGAGTLGVRGQWLLLLGWTALYVLVHVRVLRAERHIPAMTGGRG